MQKFSKSEQGWYGECQAQSYLESRGWRILARRWRGPTREYGEVDCVAWDQRHCCVWLCEVKTHEWKGVGAGFSLITPSQLERLAHSRTWWQQRHPRCGVRIAVIWVDPLSGSVQFLENSCYS